MHCGATLTLPLVRCCTEEQHVCLKCVALRSGSSMWHLEPNLEYILASGWVCQRCRWTSCCHKPYDKCSPELLCENLKGLQEQAHLQARTRSGFGTILLAPMQRAEQRLGCPWGLCTKCGVPAGRSSSWQSRSKSKLALQLGKLRQKQTRTCPRSPCKPVFSC